MTNRELLELAAKAAGIEIEWNVMINRNSPILSPKTQHERNWLGHEHTPWNPLSDDGDALRLAVKLGIDVFPWQNKAHDQRTIGIEAATRLAIVRAAAEIGKRMEVEP